MKLNLTLEKLRNQIDMVDTFLITCLAKRQEIAKEIAQIKKLNNLPIFCPEREAQLLASRKIIAENLGINSNLVIFIFKNIIKNSKKIDYFKA